MDKYLSIEEAINLIDAPNKESCKSLYEENLPILKKARGSKTKHQAWGGGYLDHVAETMNIAIIIYDAFNKRRPLPFELSDALLVLFLHDIEKPWKQLSPELNLETNGIKNRETIKEFKDKILEKYNFKLTSEHLNALEYIEGEIDYDPFKRLARPLAAFCHTCDFWSARGWYNYPPKLSWDDNAKS